MVADEFGNPFNFRRIDECTLHTRQVVACRDEHVPAADQLIRSRLVDNRPRVDHRGDAESDTRREVRFDYARDDIRRRALRGDHQMDAHRTGQLRDTRDRRFDFTAGGHDQVGKLVDHDDNIG